MPASNSEARKRHEAEHPSWLLGLVRLCGRWGVAGRADFDLPAEHEAQAGAIEEAVDDLHRAAEIIADLLDFADAATRDTRIDAEAFVSYIRETWDPMSDRIPEEVECDVCHEPVPDDEAHFPHDFAGFACDCDYRTHPECCWQCHPHAGLGPTDPPT